MDSQMKKGVLEMCLLQLISEEEDYGYSLITRLTNEFPEVSDSTAYAILRRVRSEGLVENYSGEQSGGPVRKYFRLTQLGRESLAQAKTEWNRICKAVRELGIEDET